MAAIFVDKYTQKMYNKSWQHGLGQKVLCHNNTIKLLSVENFNYYKTRMTLCFILQFYSHSEFASSVCGEYSVFVRISSCLCQCLPMATSVCTCVFACTLMRARKRSCVGVSVHDRMRTCASMCAWGWLIIRSKDEKRVVFAQCM